MKPAVRRLAEGFLSFDDAIARRASQRPGRTRRLLALAVALVSLYELTGAKTWHDGLSAASVLLWASMLAIAPRGLWDGRAQLWSKNHPLLWWPATALFVSAAGFLAVSGFTEDWKFSVVMVVVLVSLVVVRAVASSLKHPSSS
ncbi:hypothetical protein ACQHIV_28225 [Kribbella sp. GL6]|uniref:hypothetical protein n=1 Tax=Kribbella sp. GL6 TaxID=3419765 RepID=UPI003CFDD62D